MFWFGKKKAQVEELGGDVELLLTKVSADGIVLHTRKLYPLNSPLYLNATSSTVEGVRSTGIEVILTEGKRISKGTMEFAGKLTRATTELVEWLEQVKSQPALTPENRSSYVFLHLDQRLERRAYRTFQVMSPDLSEYKGVSQDISHTGIRLSVTEQLEPQSRLRLTLNFDDYNYAPVEVTGEVLWTTERDKNTWWVGLRFVDMSDAARDAIGGYMDYADGYKKKRFRGA